MNQDLQLLAKRFAEECDNDRNHKDFAEMYALKVLQWLSETFFFVEKSEVLENYRDLESAWPKCEREDLKAGYLGAMTELKMLFGKEHFINKTNDHPQV